MNKIVYNRLRMNKLLRIKEAAKMIGVSAITLRRWDLQGINLKPVIINDAGHRRYKLEDVEKFIEENKSKI